MSVCLSTGGVPISHNALQHYPECHGAARGVPSQVQPGGYPAGGYPALGSTLPGGQGGTLLGRGTQLGQHREYLLHGGRYASCVHAGGLSCSLLFENDRGLFFRTDGGASILFLLTKISSDHKFMTSPVLPENWLQPL